MSTTNLRGVSDQVNMTVTRLVEVLSCYTWKGNGTRDEEANWIASLEPTESNGSLRVCTTFLNDVWLEASLSASIEAASPEQQSWLVNVEHRTPRMFVNQTSKEDQNPNEKEGEEDVFFDAVEGCSDGQIRQVDTSHHAIIPESLAPLTLISHRLYTLLWPILRWIKRAGGCEDCKINTSNHHYHHHYHTHDGAFETPRGGGVNVKKSRSVVSSLSRSSCHSARSLQASFDLAAERPERFLLALASDSPPSSASHRINEQEMTDR